MRVAFVVQRYGLDVNGGAEHLCRMLAERLALRPELDSVTVLTTCAKDYRTWQNHYQPGIEMLGGVRVERFPTRMQRISPLQSLLGLALRGPHPRFLEWPWLWSQGPVAPALIERLSEVKRDYDAFIFFTYLYYPTVAGLPRVPGRRILVPCAHDEPAIRLELFREVFEAPEALVFNTQEERSLVLDRFRVPIERTEIAGCGVDVSAAPTRTSEALGKPYLLYLGRIAKNKGVPALVRSFDAFKRQHADRSFTGVRGRYFGRDLELYIVGEGDRKLVPSRPDVILTGFVSDERKAELLAQAETLMMPSLYESLSLVMLEAWAAKVPVLVERACAVTSGHIARSGGGLTYHGEAEFSAALSVILSSQEQRDGMAAAGHSYVALNYSWERVETKLLDLVRRVSSGGSA